jgi:hypothetical protein
LNPNLCRVVLRPRGPLEVFDLGVRLVATNAGPLLRLSALLVLPAWGVCSTIAIAAPEWPGLPLAAAALLAFPIQAPFTLMGGRLLFQETVSAREVLRATASLWASCVGVWTIQAFAMVLGMAMCGWGLLITLIPTLFVAETTLLERVEFSRSLRRSTRLASAHPGTAAVGALGYFGLVVWGGIVGEFGGAALLGTVLQLGSPFGTMLTGSVTPGLLLGVLAAQPLYAIYRLMLYVDVRTRVEGWDLQVLLRAAGLGQ